MTRNLIKKRLAFVFLSGFALVAPAARPASAAAPCGTENLLAGKKPHMSADIKGELSLLTDGNVGPEGAEWNVPVGVIIETPTGGVTYDLGEARSLSAIVVQADANDVYKISGSMDGSPSSYKPITEIANVVAQQGHGLRTRAVEFPAMTVRYLRFGEQTGDMYYSVSEIQAFCSKPTPFPPKLKVVDIPASAPGAAPTTVGSKDGGRSFLLLAVAALGLAWLAYRTIKRAPPKPDGAGEGAAPTDAPGSSDKPPGEGGGTGPAAPGGST
jgi:hypothetical protein